MFPNCVINNIQIVSKVEKHTCNLILVSQPRKLRFILCVLAMISFGTEICWNQKLLIYEYDHELIPLAISCLLVSFSNWEIIPPLIPSC